MYYISIFSRRRQQLLHSPAPQRQSFLFSLHILVLMIYNFHSFFILIHNTKQKRSRETIFPLENKHRSQWQENPKVVKSLLCIFGFCDSCLISETYLTFWDCLPSLSWMMNRCIHIVAKDGISLFFPYWKSLQEYWQRRLFNIERSHNLQCSITQWWNRKKLRFDSSRPSG